MKRETRAAEIRELLLSKLGTKWRVGDRLPPMKQLARLLKRGETNTHQAVRALVSEGLLASRQRRGTYVRKIPDSQIISASIRTGMTCPTIDLLHCDKPDGFIVRMVDAFTDAIAASGATVHRRLIPGVTPKAKYEVASDADAIVIFNPGASNVVQCRPRQMMCMVSTAAQLVAPPSERFDCVSVDEFQGGSLAGRMLRSIGCVRGCFLGRGVPPAFTRCDETSAMRLYGFEHAWGTPLCSSEIILRQGYSASAGAEAFARYMQIRGRRPDGIFAASDDLVIGFISAATAKGLKAGRDFQIIGFDGQHRGQALARGGITTIKVPAMEMGRRAAMLLTQRLADPDSPNNHLRLECVIHRGATTRGPVASSKKCESAAAVAHRSQQPC